MSATTATSRQGTARALVIGWVCALVGFLVGAYGAGLVLVSLHSSSGGQAVLDWSWLPWIAAAVLCGLAAGLGTPADAETPWWRWIVVGAPIPICAGLVTWAYFASYGVPVPGQAVTSLVQVVIAVGLALAIGSLRGRLTGSEGRPVQEHR
ncbi:hypothetical protein [Isoptericola croceus]|uniref:hypothetical protein n=1 Tax=Isoptericola croceus TaxID=3031406 RepID=UPI0023F9A252|nr:hypothetical protein [Isoptericola croceus]